MNRFWPNTFAKQPAIRSRIHDVCIVYPFENRPTVLKEYEYIGISRQLPKLFLEWRPVDKMVVIQPSRLTTKGVQPHKYSVPLIPTWFCPDSPKPIIVKRLSWFPEELRTQFEEYPKIIENTEKSLGNVILNLNSKPLQKKVLFWEWKAICSFWRKSAYEGLSVEMIICKQKQESKRNWRWLTTTSGYFLITWDIIQYSISQGLSRRSVAC
jgi:DNA polymerase-3 subunit alpha/error-prone DNA polymerase